MTATKNNTGKKVENYPNLGERLRTFRESAHLDVSDLASKTGISVSGIRKMEGADSNPTFDTLKSYLEHCGVSLGQFFDPWYGKEYADKRIHNMVQRLLDDSELREGVVFLLEMANSRHERKVK